MEGEPMSADSALIDVSLPVGPDLLTWPGDPGIEIRPSSQISKGDPANVSQLRLGSHTGSGRETGRGRDLPSGRCA